MTGLGRLFMDDMLSPGRMSRRCLLSFTDLDPLWARRRPLDHTSVTSGCGPCGLVQGLHWRETGCPGRLPQATPRAYAAARGTDRVSKIIDTESPMNDVADDELERFLAAHPATRFFDAFVNDLNTVERGKRIDRDGIARVFARGMPLPGSMYALDIEGGTNEATGLGFDDGDADRPCMPIPRSLVPVPWQADVAQVQLTMYDTDGSPFFGDPRHLLANVLARFTRLSLTPVVAIEYEFYLVDVERDPQGQPQPTKGPLTGRR